MIKTEDDYRKHFRRGMIFVHIKSWQYLIVKDIKWNFFGCDILFEFSKSSCTISKGHYDVKYSEIAISKDIIELSPASMWYNDCYYPVTDKGTLKIMDLIKGEKLDENYNQKS